MKNTILEWFGMAAVQPYKASKLPAVDIKLAAPDQIVGLEIETENCPLGMGAYDRMLNGIWETKTDGSLRGNAYEFISKPAEIKILIPELLEFYKKTGFTDDNYTDRCSIHVHTNVQDMTKEQVATLCLLYSVFEEVLFEFVNHYKVDDPRGKYRDTNLYCVPWNQCRMNQKMVASVLYETNYVFRGWQKYTALNIIPARTIGTFEWRHMHGTADTNKLILWLNIIGSLMSYAKQVEFDKVVETIKKLNDNSAYRVFFMDVFKEHFEYQPDYEARLISGVVDAKYCLMGLSKAKNKPKLEAKEKANPFLAMYNEANWAPAEPEYREEIDALLDEARVRVEAAGLLQPGNVDIARQQIRPRVQRQPVPLRPARAAEVDALAVGPRPWIRCTFVNPALHELRFHGAVVGRQGERALRDTAGRLLCREADFGRWDIQLDEGQPQIRGFGIDFFRNLEQEVL
jgi:hypothetical protein